MSKGWMILERQKAGAGWGWRERKRPIIEELEQQTGEEPNPHLSHIRESGRVGKGGNGMLRATPWEVDLPLVDRRGEGAGSFCRLEQGRKPG